MSVDRIGFAPNPPYGSTLAASQRPSHARLMRRHAFMTRSAVLLAFCVGWFAGAVRAAEPPPAAANSSARSASGGYWAFKRLSIPSQVPVASSGRTPVDGFVVEKLAEKSLQLAPEADRLTLLRRATFDLIGLPPTPEEIAAFLADDRADAYERLIDRLLASPHFGERFGRHWLDAAGYSDITGGDNDAGIIKLSEGRWKYRDYVVRSFNQDKPYDRFLVEQLAGDELVDWRTAAAFTPEMEELLVATGFLRNAADDTDEKELTTPDILNGILQRTGEVVANNLLGLTWACAKCHDHKYEPITQVDYYRLLANFTPTFNPSSWVPPKNRALADISPTQKASAEEHNKTIGAEIDQLKKQQADLRRPFRERLFDARLVTVSEPIRADVKAAFDTPAEKRSEVQKYLVQKFQPSVGVSDAEVAAALGEAEKQQLAAADRRIADLEKTRRSWGLIQAAYDVGPPPETHLLMRGNHETPGEVVEPGFPSALYGPASNSPGAATLNCRALKPAGTTSGRRLALAQWLSDWDSPAGGLVARVYVNRIWQHLFGRGIVETSENLGTSGTEPSHRELLEWLACRWVADGCQTKPLVKLLVTSSVYRQASAVSPTSEQALLAQKLDPGNQLLWHMPLRRLEAEIVRDAMLAVGGELDPKLGGSPLPLEVQSDGMVVVSERNLPAGAKARRSLYVLARRNYHLSLLGVFDQPAMSTNCPHRLQSAVVLQSLTMLNDAEVLAQADRFAKRVCASTTDTGPRIALAFRIALGRDPSPQESDWSQQLLAEHASQLSAGNLSVDEQARKALSHLCHMLLNTNEFLYIP